MSLSRVRAILLQEVYITRRSGEVLIDLPFFSLSSVVVFGFISSFLSSTAGLTVGRYLFLGMLLWEIVRVAQYSMSIEALWNVWSHNLSNMFITPLSISEYVLAQMISATVKALLIFGVLALIAGTLFSFNLSAMGLGNLALFFVNLLFFAWSVGLAVLGIIFRFGTRIQALAWGLVYLFPPLAAAYYPLSVLPPPLQVIGRLIPATYVFEAARASLQQPATDWRAMGMAFGENAIYFGLAVLFFSYMYRRSRLTGQFARNEE
jgi:ABC-2 type transport system permease protein